MALANDGADRQPGRCHPNDRQNEKEKDEEGSLGARFGRRLGYAEGGNKAIRQKLNDPHPSIMRCWDVNF